MNHENELYLEYIELIENDYAKFYSIVYRITENHQNTEEALQNTFLAAYKNLSKFKRKSKLSTWIYKIAINESQKFMKTWNKLPVVTITENLKLSEKEFFKTLEYKVKPEDKILIDDLREKCIYGFLRCIPKTMRLCFTLKICLELKNREIAEILDITESNVKVMLHRVRKQLREMYEMRCSLIDPSKPCKCHLWVKFMKDRNLSIPDGYNSVSYKELLMKHREKMTSMEKIELLYKVQNTIDKDQFIDKIKKIIKTL